MMMMMTIVGITKERWFFEGIDFFFFDLMLAARRNTIFGIEDFSGIP